MDTRTPLCWRALTLAGSALFCQPTHSNTLAAADLSRVETRARAFHKGTLSWRPPMIPALAAPSARVSAKAALARRDPSQKANALRAGPVQVRRLRATGPPKARAMPTRIDGALLKDLQPTQPAVTQKWPVAEGTGAR